MFQKSTIVLLVTLVVLNLFVNEINAKRGIAIARRAKGSGKSYTSRRGRGQDHGPDLTHGDRTERHSRPASAPAHAPAAAPKPDISANPTNNAAKPIGWDVNNNNKPVGPPPAYPGLGGSSSMHGAPPSYGQAVGGPPSYPGTYGSYGYGYPQNNAGSVQRIPARGQSGPTPVDTTSFHGLGSGHNVHGGPSYTGGLYNGGNAMPNGGVYHNNFNQPGMNNAGTYSGAGGGYGQGYGYGGGSSSGFSFGNVLTGLALWNVARGFNSYPSHSHSQQHVHYHDHRDQTGVTQQTPLPGGDILPTASPVNPQLSPTSTFGTAGVHQPTLPPVPFVPHSSNPISTTRIPPIAG